ncbi:uncharacterized protein [Palaemon carinicauda]|uniref:uncharacterized protein n=1 Tax=Palaemon carinicauda TaxID=392227 RepID=UPI0035B68EEC
MTSLQSKDILSGLRGDNSSHRSQFTPFPETKQHLKLIKMDKARAQKEADNYRGYKMIIVMTIIASVMLYTVGAVLTGIAYRLERGYNCTREGMGGPDHSKISGYGYNNVLVIVGPSFMAAGGAIITVIIFQWCFCRPAIKE